MPDVPDIYSKPPVDIYAKKPATPASTQTGGGVPDIYSSNPMDLAQPSSGPGNIGGIAAGAAGSALSSIAGHQDIMFILLNAKKRDEVAGRNRSLVDLLRDPKSMTHTAFQLWMKNPTAAMDEYGLNAPAQVAFDAAHGDPLAKVQQKHPVVNAALTVGEEMFNPAAILEGGLVGQAAHYLGAAIKGTKVERAAQAAAKATGFGSPMTNISNRAGVKGVSWANSLLHSVQAPEKFYGMEKTEDFYKKVFGGLSPDEQWEVQRLSEGLMPRNSIVTSKGAIPTHENLADLKARAKMLREDERVVTQHQLRTKLMKKEQARKNFSPMSGNYEFQVRPTVESERHGIGQPGGKFTASKPKTYQNTDEALKSGKLLATSLPAQNWANWRNARMSSVAFEDALDRAPQSLRIQSSKGLRKRLIQNGGTINGQEYRYVANPREVFSPAMRKGALAPELIDFIDGHNGLRNYIGRGGAIPGSMDDHGIASNWAKKFIALSRNMIVSNFYVHPVFNVAPNASIARTVGNTGGPRAELGGILYNMARGVAQQLGLDPTKFAGGAKKYAHWLDRALKAGATGEFGMPTKSAFGRDRMRTLTVPEPDILHRLDKALTQYGSFNRERTFGSRGEESFAVSLFKDAVESGMKDEEAGQLVRNAFHDYYNFDPNSPWAYVDLFMPWRKGNWKFYANVLMKHPQIVTSQTHGIRNYNLQTNPDAMQSAFASPDFQIQGKDSPWTPLVPGRDIQYGANAIGSVLQGDPRGALSSGLSLLTGSANPLARGAMNALRTADAAFSKDVEGPETSWGVLFNPKAPKEVQRAQMMTSVLQILPKPLVGFAVNQALARGWAPSDLIHAVGSAAGLGYAGAQRLDSTQKMALSKAKKRYLKAYYSYEYDTQDDDALREAWSEYMDKLQDIGVIK